MFGEYILFLLLGLVFRLNINRPCPSCDVRVVIWLISNVSTKTFLISYPRVYDYFGTKQKKKTGTTVNALRPRTAFDHHDVLHHFIILQYTQYLQLLLFVAFSVRASCRWMGFHHPTDFSAAKLRNLIAGVGGCVDEFRECAATLIAADWASKITKLSKSRWTMNFPQKLI